MQHHFSSVAIIKSGCAITAISGANTRLMRTTCILLGFYGDMYCLSVDCLLFDHAFGLAMGLQVIWVSCTTGPA
jgi:hypothetical protein